MRTLSLPFYRLASTAAMDGSTRTITGLKRWSCLDQHLPEVGKIKAIHVYDFDNTRELDHQTCP